MKISRRNFLAVSSLAGGGLAISLSLPSFGKSAISAPVAKATKLNTFLTIDTTGKITFLLTKHEMGQGSGTGMPMMLMEELGGDWSQLEIKRADYHKDFDSRVMGTTGGSGTIMFTWDIMRNAGATAREMLKAAAANRWSVPVENLVVANGFVINPASNENLGFGELAETAALLPVPEKVTLTSPADYKFIGKPVKNLLTKDVIKGAARYGIDTDVEGMVYVAIERCPVYKGKLINYDDSDARQIEGVLDIIPIPGFEEAIKGHNHVQEGVAVIATSTWIAFKARKALRINWDYGEHGNASNHSFGATLDAAARTVTDPAFAFGNTELLLQSPENEIVEVQYDNPHQAHALMEPINSTVHFRGDSCEVWVGNQDGWRITTEVARIVGLPEDRVTTHVLNSGGSFGRRWYADSSMEAAYLSKQTGKPVKVTWSREDEIRHDFFHPYQRNYFKAIIDRENKVAGVENHIIKTDEYAAGTSLWDQLYYFPNVKVSMKTIPAVIHQGAWRSVSEHSATLGLECFIDELAHRIGADPLEYRLELVSRQFPIDHLGPEEELDPGIREWAIPSRINFFTKAPIVLNYLKDKKLWDIELPPGKGKGLALGKFGKTVIAQIAIVDIGDPDHGFKVEKVTAVVHCGQVVNPHFGQGQIEGSILWALSAVKYGGIRIGNGRVLQSNYHDNKIVRIDDTPEMEVHFIDSNDAPSGLGEPGTPPLAPAVLNAIFNASGKRIRSIPVTKEMLAT